MEINSGTTRLSSTSTVVAWLDLCGAVAVGQSCALSPLGDLEWSSASLPSVPRMSGGFLPVLSCRWTLEFLERVQLGLNVPGTFSSGAFVTWVTWQIPNSHTVYLYSQTALKRPTPWTVNYKTVLSFRFVPHTSYISWRDLFFYMYHHNNYTLFCIAHSSTCNCETQTLTPLCGECTGEKIAGVNGSLILHRMTMTLSAS